MFCVHVLPLFYANESPTLAVIMCYTVAFLMILSLLLTTSRILNAMDFVHLSFLSFRISMYIYISFEALSGNCLLSQVLKINGGYPKFLRHFFLSCLFCSVSLKYTFR